MAQSRLLAAASFRPAAARSRLPEDLTLNGPATFAYTSLNPVGNPSLLITGSNTFVSNGNTATIDITGAISGTGNFCAAQLLWHRCPAGQVGSLSLRRFPAAETASWLPTVQSWIWT